MPVVSPGAEKEDGASRLGSESPVGRRGKGQGKRTPNLDVNIIEILRLRLGRKASGVRRPVGPGQQRRNDQAWRLPQNRFNNSLVKQRRCEIGGCEQRLIASERPLMWKIPSDNQV